LNPGEITMISAAARYAARHERFSRRPTISLLVLDPTIPEFVTLSGHMSKTWRTKGTFRHARRILAGQADVIGG
jgi:hypothetical protein